MIEDMTAATFTGQMNTKFNIRLSPSDVVELELIRVDEFEPTPRQERFSIIFRGPLEQAIWQGTYNFEHDQLGAFELFIVPIGQEESGLVYEAAFNRFKKKQ